MEENKKTAVEIGINLSTNIIAATLALIAILGGLSTFLVDKKESNTLLYTAIGLIIFSFIAFVVSIYQGAKGIDKVRKSVFSGEWSLDISKNRFNLQAIWCFLGILSFIVVLIMCLGNDKKGGDEIQLEILNQKIEELIIIQQGEKETNEKVKALESKVDSMQNLVKLLQESIN
jgi:hypothetical protein